MSTVAHEKTIKYIPATKKASVKPSSDTKLKRVAAYCRVSTDDEDQINSYEVQKRKYTEMILAEPGWELVGIYADKGLSGTQTKHRTEFNRLIRHCKNGKIDMVITKSISRLARNNLDMLTYTRKLRDIGVDIYFEEQNIHSIDPASDFMISIHGSIAQSESENISQNVRWGKIQSAKEGKVPFTYKNFLGYRKGADGKPEIDPEEAKIIQLIYSEFLAGKTYRDICKFLEDKGIRTPTGKNKWGHATVESILKNEKYKGDYVTNKTFVADVLSKKVKKNL